MNIRKDSSPLKWILIGISVLFLFVMLILPLSYVMYTAFSKGIKVFLAAVTDKYALHSIKLTIEVSLIAVVCNTFFGIFASWLITKFQFKGKKIISTLIDLPLTVSPIIAGLIYVLTFGSRELMRKKLRHLWAPMAGLYSGRLHSRISNGRFSTVLYCVQRELWGSLARYPFFQDICAEELTRCRCILNFCIRDMILQEHLQCQQFLC